MNAQPAATLVRAWVDLYTRGLPEAARVRRRDEVQDDLWCQQEEALAVGRSAPSVNAEMFVRLLFGMPADVGWRMSSNRDGGPELEREPSTEARLLGILALLGVAGWGTAIVGYLALGEDAWATQGLLLYVAQLFGGLGFAGAALGIALRFQDRIGVVGAIAGVLGGLAALFGAMGAWQLSLFLPIGTAVMAWDLGRAGVISRPLAVAHSVSGLLTLPILLSFAFAWSWAVVGIGGFIVLMVPYLMSWVGIAVWLIRGVPVAHKTDAASHRPL